MGSGLIACFQKVWVIQEVVNKWQGFFLSYLPYNSFQGHICNWFVLAYEPGQGCKPAEKANQGKKCSGQSFSWTGTNVGRKEGQECVVSGSSTDFECKTAFSVKRIAWVKMLEGLLIRMSREKAWNVFKTWKCSRKACIIYNYCDALYFD